MTTLSAEVFGLSFPLTQLIKAFVTQDTFAHNIATSRLKYILIFELPVSIANSAAFFKRFVNAKS
jgi:hypothetical protein